MSLGRRLHSLTNLPDINIEQCRLAQYKIRYDVLEGKKKVGNADRLLTNENTTAVLTTELNAAIAFISFSQSEKSILLDYKTSGLASIAYTKQRKKPFRKTQKTSIAISQPLAKINSESKNELTYLFDPLSVYDHLRELVCSGLRSNVDLPVQEESKVERYIFEYIGIQELTIQNRTINTVLFNRIREANSRITSIWFNTEDNFLPIKISQEKNDQIQAVLVAQHIEASL